MVNEYDENHVVQWRHPAGHQWRWELVEIEPGTTQVTETFDYSTAKAPRVLELMGQPGKNTKGITATLQALADRFS